MKDRKLLVLTVVFLVLAGSAYQLQRGTPSPSTNRQDTLLDLNLESVQRVDVISPMGTVSVKNNGGSWVMTSQADYPIDVQRLRDFMQALVDLKPGEEVMGGETMLEELGLGDQATVVRWYGSGTEPQGSLLLGNTHINENAGPMGYGGLPDGQYARVGPGPVYLLAEVPRGLPQRPLAWLDTRLFQFPPAEIDTVQVQPRDGSPYTLEVKGYSDFALVGMDTNLTLDTTEAGKVARGFQYLSFTGVEPVSTNFVPGVQVDLVADNGLQVTLTLEQDSNRVRYDVSLVPPPAPEEEEALQDYHDNQEAARKTLADLQARRDWIYTLSPSAADAFRVTRDALVKKPEPKTEDIQDVAPGADM